MSKTAVIIPARWASTRFPGKPLFPILGKPLLQHCWERCLKAKSVSQVIIATDDMRIAEAAFEFGAEVAVTSPKHPSGTDRVAEVARKLTGVTNIINVQGDEPAIDPRLIDKLAARLDDDRKLDMVTAAVPFADFVSAANPNNVKVVTTKDGRALYFSRSLIPFDRDQTGTAKYFWHVGIYGYRRAFLSKFVAWKPTPLEQSEKLEQLRVLENGASIGVIIAKEHGVGVDTPEDVERAEKILRGKKR
ncbi:3-deoxy-manno-octulosonate cytidylyltransferase [Spartobacteria bacterium LR76]|nr:3-deoxy-manno-octulosonate cytidylyltransferase [Spartobacteria bacterium LR76]